MSSGFIGQRAKRVKSNLMEPAVIDSLKTAITTRNTRSRVIFAQLKNAHMVLFDICFVIKKGLETWTLHVNMEYQGCAKNLWLRFASVKRKLVLYIVHFQWLQALCISQCNELTCFSFTFFQYEIRRLYRDVFLQNVSANFCTCSDIIARPEENLF